MNTTFERVQNMTTAEKIAAIPYWYHKITLPDGTVTPGWSPIDAERYCIPQDLTGKKIGPFLRGFSGHLAKSLVILEIVVTLSIRCHEFLPLFRV